MADIRIVTDSGCDLPAPLAEGLGITIVPLTVRFGAEEYRDREELSPEAFYAKMAAAPALPETAAPAPGAFETVIGGLLDEGAAGVAVLTLSGALSATYTAAAAAAKAFGEARVRVVDSRAITMGQGMLCVQAAESAGAGASLEEVVAVVEAAIPRTRIYGALDTLDNLKRGGRIGGAQALLGSLLSVKPVLDLSTGEVRAESKQRTRARAIRHLADLVAETVKEHGGVERLAVMHGRAPDVGQLLDLLSGLYPRERIVVGEIGATIGAHGGPRVVGVTFQVPA